MSSSRESTFKYEQKIELGKSSALDLACENCGSHIAGTNININSSLAKCAECNSVFSIKEDHFFLHDRRRRPEMIMPEGTDVLKLNDSLDIRLDWLKSHPSGSLGFLTFFAIFWNGFLAVMSMNMAVGLEFLSLHLLVGLGLIYYLATIYLNYTDIIVNDSFIEINHRPIKNPFIQNKKIKCSDITQLYVSKYVSSTTNGVPNYAYALYAILKPNGSKFKLLNGMNKETQLYLEQEIERYLIISDRPVSDAIEA